MHGVVIPEIGVSELKVAIGVIGSAVVLSGVGEIEALFDSDDSLRH